MNYEDIQMINDKYSIKGHILSRDKKLDLEGTILICKNNEIKGTGSITPGKYSSNIHIYGLTYIKNDKVILILRFPHEFKIGDYVSSNGATINNLSGEYVGLFNSMNLAQYDKFIHSFIPTKDISNTTLVLTKLDEK
ncbi:MAG: hypothetical protein WC758_02555 [Candidatus Woesearchaeota archaeon]|jgi:hypothetical protein